MKLNYLFALANYTPNLYSSWSWLIDHVEQKESYPVDTITFLSTSGNSSLVYVYRLPKFWDLSSLYKVSLFLSTLHHFAKSGKFRHHYSHNWGNSIAMHSGASCHLNFFLHFTNFLLWFRKLNPISMDLLMAFQSHSFLFILFLTLLF